MKHYKLNNEVYAFELDGSQDHLIQPDMVEMTTEEVEAHINPPLTQQQLDDIAFAEWKASQEQLKEAQLRAEYEASK